MSNMLMASNGKLELMRSERDVACCVYTLYAPRTKSCLTVCLLLSLETFYVRLFTDNVADNKHFLSCLSFLSRPLSLSQLRLAFVQKQDTNKEIERGKNAADRNFKCILNK